MTPGFTQSREQLPWLYYPESDRVIINAHNFNAPTTWNPTATWGRFDGTNDHVNCGTLSGLLSTEITLSLWVWRSANTDTAVISKSQYTAWELDTMSAYQMLFYLASGSSNIYRTGSAFATGAWHHLVITKTSADAFAKYYLDGVLQSPSMLISSVGFNFGNANTLYLGGRNGSSLMFNGRLADVRIYNIASNSSGVTWLNTGGVSGTDPGASNLKARYKFDEGSGTTVGDSSGNANHGTAVNITPASFWTGA